MKYSFLKPFFLISGVIILLFSCGKDDDSPCINIQCLNGGICLDGGCDCPEGFAGVKCEIQINPCDNIGCLNGGACIDGTCHCPDGYTGENCETEITNFYCQTGNGGTENHTKIQRYQEYLIFQGGTEGYHTYRNPAIITTNQGTLIAFCEGRKDSHEDYGNIDLVYKRSTDNGSTWDSLQVVWGTIEPGTIGNATPVIDKETGTIWLFMSYNDENHAQILNGTVPPAYDGIDEWGDRRVYSMTSTDDGETWSNRIDHTTEVLPPGRCWDNVGPGNGIQLKHGDFAGRLVIPANGRNIYSDDNGQSWSYQLIHPGTSEGTIVELCNGDLMRNDRGACNFTCYPYGPCTLKEDKRRQISISSDGGLSWNSWRSDMSLLDPACQASLIRYNEDYPARLIFVNPASEENRFQMRVRISYDEGQSWPIQRCLNTSCGPNSPRIGGYSSITKTSDFQIACLHSTGKNESDDNRYSIIFKKFNIPWILNGTPEPVD